MKNILIGMPEGQLEEIKKVGIIEGDLSVAATIRRATKKYCSRILEKNDAKIES